MDGLGHLQSHHFLKNYFGKDLEEGELSNLTPSCICGGVAKSHVCLMEHESVMISRNAMENTFLVGLTHGS